MDNRLKILIATTVLLILGGVIGGIIVSLPDQGSGGAPKMKADSTYYDFGDVSMAQGLARSTFKITNDGTADLKISNIATSCMCTKAVLEVDGQKSPEFGMPGHGGANPAFWSAEIKPGQTANLEVIFDPNAHGPDATGPVTRAITFSSNDGGVSNVRATFTVTANVTK